MLRRLLSSSPAASLSFSSGPTPGPGSEAAAAGRGGQDPSAAGLRVPASSPRRAGASYSGLPAGPWALLLLLALLAGLPWMLATPRVGWLPGVPAAVPAQAGLSIALEGDTTPAAYEEGGPPIAVGSAADARVFLRQFAPELAAAGSEILGQAAARQGWRARQVTLAQLVLLRDGQVVARYDVSDGGTTRPAWIRFARLAGRWQPVHLVVGEPGQAALPAP